MGHLQGESTFGAKIQSNEVTVCVAHLLNLYFLQTIYVCNCTRWLTNLVHM